jgi:uncharacterized protein YndB with AHSA1/START domain
MPTQRQINDAAVRKATGQVWDYWFRVLDRWKAIEKGHTATARYLKEVHQLPGWWSQMVTVQHEKERRARVVGQRGRTFEVGVTRTVAAPVDRCFRVFLEPKEQSAWFTTKAKADLRVGGRYSNADGDQGEFLAIQPTRRLRFTWENAKHCPGTVVEVTFIAKDKTKSKTLVALTHQKLASTKDRESMKRGWSWAMDSYRSYVETGQAISNEAWEKARKSRARTRSRKATGKVAVKAPAERGRHMRPVRTGP